MSVPCEGVRAHWVRAPSLLLWLLVSCNHVHRGLVLHLPPGSPLTPLRKAHTMFDLSAPDATVRLDVLRRVVNNLDGDLFVGHTEDEGRTFWVDTINEIQEFISESGVAEFVEDARGHAPGLGEGSPLDLMGAQQMLLIAARVDAADFVGPVNLKGAADLTDVVRRTLHAVYEDVWSAVGAALDSRVLGWSSDRLVVVR